MQKLAEDPDFQYLAVDRKKLMHEAPPFDTKKNVFITCEKEGYARAEVLSTKGDDVVVQNMETLYVRHCFQGCIDI